MTSSALGLGPAGTCAGFSAAEGALPEKDKRSLGRGGLTSVSRMGALTTMIANRMNSIHNRTTEMKDPFQLVDNEYCHVADDILMSDSAVLGCMPERDLSDLSLVIGEGAVIRSGSIIYAGTRIGHRLNLGHHSIIREENRIGDNFSLWSNSTIDYGCVIGNRVKIHHNVYVAQYTILEDDVFLAPGVMIANDPHPGCEYSRKCMKGPTIKRGAQIGVNATILPFVTIGEKALVGAGSVVTKDVPSGAVVVGNPARISGDIMSLTCVVTPRLTEHPYS